MAPSDTDVLWATARDVLLRGPATADQLVRALGVSQPTLSRLVAKWTDRILMVGRGRATRYLGTRQIGDAGAALPVTEIREDGTARPLGTLHGAMPDGYHFESAQPDCNSHTFEDLPYFLNELRPAGFLGRLIPRQHPELGFSTDVTLWTGDNAVTYASRFGWDMPGNLIVGEAAFQQFMRNTQSPTPPVADDQRAQRYPELADNVLAAGTAGSSAAGEQPKFLVPRSTDGETALVKFSPRLDGPVAERVRDMLIAEHLALETIRGHGQAAAQTRLLSEAGRTFLQSHRFDRLPNFGRKGVVSLFALDAHYLGHLSNWIDSCDGLIQLGVLPASLRFAVRWRQRFGELIGNTDMHSGNLAFFTHGFTPNELTPAYDMTPARYAPRGAELPPLAPITPPLPMPADAAVFDSVCEAAEAFWDQVGHHNDISDPFRIMALENLVVVRGHRALGARLPKASGP